MFTNLIESSSHVREFKRRGSFFLYTIAAYSLLFVGGGIASIYAYDAHLDEQTTAAIVTVMPTSQPEVQKSVHQTQPVRTTRGTSAHPGSDERRNPTATTSQLLVPPKVSADRNPELPVRPDNAWRDSNRDVDYAAGLVGRSDRSGGENNNSAGVTVEMGTPPPPPPPVKKYVPQTIKISDVLNGRAISLPKPAYPTLAIRIQLSGQVSVQVLIDETGKVVSAHAVSGHPVLAPGAVRAAYQARFSPTIVGDTRVKVSGIIHYNFVLE